MAVSKVPRLYLPETKCAYFDYLDEVDKLDLIVTTLQKAKINPYELVYCGVEGRPLASSKTLPIRDQTYGCTYANFRILVEEVDKYGTAGGLHPLEYAFFADDLPAMVMYDEAQIEEDDLNIWHPKRGSTLESATRAVMFFAV